MTKESQKNGKYPELARELKKTEEHKIDDYTNAFGTVNKDWYKDWGT